MHISSAALLLLLAPAARAAAIPNQGDLPAVGDSLINKGDLPKAALDGVLGPAPTSGDEAASLLASIGKTPIDGRGAVDELVGSIDNVEIKDNKILRKSIHQEKRDDVEEQLREYIAETFPELSTEEAEQLLADLLAAHDINSLKATRDTTGIVDKIAKGTGELSAQALEEDGDSINPLEVAENLAHRPFPVGRDLADQLAPATDAAAGAAAPVDPLEDLIAGLAETYPDLSLEELKALAEHITGTDGPEYVERDGEAIDEADIVVSLTETATGVVGEVGGVVGGLGN